MSFNSELQKCCWQQMSFHKMLLLPAIIGGIVLFIIFLNNDIISAADTIANASLFGFSILVFFYGGYKAANAVVEEINDNTWDNQRLSSVSPWELTFGKLFGSTIYAWYGGAITLILYTLTSTEEYKFYNILQLILSALVCHSVAILASIQSLRQKSRYRKIQIIGYYLLGLIVSSIFYSMSNTSTSIAFNVNFFQNITWYGTEFKTIYFVPFILFIYAFWFIVGIYRLFREELQIKNIPWVWGSFVIFNMVFLAGFVPQEMNIFEKLHSALDLTQQIKLYVAFSVATITIYLALYTDTLDITRYRVLRNRFQNKQWCSFLQTIPLWVVSFSLALISGFLFMLLSFEKKVFLFVISSIFFLIRDAAIVHYFTFSPKYKRPVLTAILYLGILYILLPAIFITGFEEGSIFYPAIKSESVVSIFPSIVQAIFMLWLLRKRYTKLDQAVLN